MALTIDACVAQHIGDRREQQDRVGLFVHPRQKGVLAAVVADGMGGHAGGALAAEQVLHTARTSFERFAPKLETAAQMLGETFSEAHLLIRACRFLNEKDPHSTAVMLVIQPHEDGLRATWAHCGDSRLYRFRGEALVLQTRDHTRVAEMLQQGKISPEQAAGHPGRNVLAASLGAAEAPRIDYASSDDLQPGDSFLLCSDGLWEYFGASELAATLAARCARDAARHLVAQARERARRMGDNCSLAIIRLVEAPADGG